MSARRYSLLSLWFAVTSLVVGQEPPSLGIKAGVNFANFDDDKSHFLAGFVGGGFVTYGLEEWLTLQPELIFSAKGARLIEQAEGYLPVEFDIRLNYLEIPFLAKVNLSMETSLKPSVFAGPFVASYTQNVLQMDFGLVVGSGLSVDLGMSSLSFDVRYTFGLRKVANLSTVFRDSVGSVVYENKRQVKTNVISVIMGYALY